MEKKKDAAARLLGGRQGKKRERREVAAKLGSRGGRRGGPARRKAMSPAERRASSEAANAARGARPRRTVAELPIRLKQWGNPWQCRHCKRRIKIGQTFRDGGPGRRYHTRRQPGDVLLGLGRALAGACDAKATRRGGAEAP